VSEVDGNNTFDLFPCFTFIILQLLNVLFLCKFLFKFSFYVNFCLKLLNAFNLIVIYIMQPLAFVVWVITISKKVCTKFTRLDVLFNFKIV